MKKVLKIMLICAVFCVTMVCFLAPPQVTSYALSDDNIECLVYGNATQTCVADGAEIHISIENLDTDLQKAKEKSFNQFNELSQALSNLEIKVENFYTNPNIDYSCEKQIVGYYAILNCVIETDDIESIEDVVDIATTNNASISYINLTLSNANEIYLNCLVEAKNNAIENAKRLLESDSIRVLEIEEESKYYASTKYVNTESVIQNNFSYEIEINATVSVKCEKI